MLNHTTTAVKSYKIAGKPAKPHQCARLPNPEDIKLLQDFFESIVETLVFEIRESKKAEMQITQTESFFNIRILSSSQVLAEVIYRKIDGTKLYLPPSKTLGRCGSLLDSEFSELKILKQLCKDLDIEDSYYRFRFRKLCEFASEGQLKEFEVE